MFATLYALAGPAAFNRIIGGFYQEHANGGTTRELADWAKRNGGPQVTRLFDDWLFTTRWSEVIASSSSIAEIAARYHVSVKN